MAFNRERALAAAAKFSARGQHDRAAREYAAIVEADPSDLRSWVMLADCLVRAGDNAGAIDRFNRIAEFYAQAGEPTKAIAVYRQILNLDANRLDVHLKVGALLHEIGRTPDAVATYEFVAQSYFQGGQVADGLEAFRMVADLEPTAVAKRLRVAELYSREGRKAEAVEHFKLAARQLHAGRRYDDYVRVAERLLFHKEDDLEVLRNLAEIYLLMQKEARRALLKLNALLRLAPTDPGGLELLAETFVALGKQDKAVSVAVELAKEQRKHEVEGKERAARVLRKALGWNPDKPAELRKALGEIEAELEVLKAGEPEVLIDVAEAEPDELAAEEDDLDLDVDIDEGGADDQEDEVGDDGYDKDLSDEEKILREAQVYVQYRMFEHALSHLGGVLGPDPGNVVALELKVRCLEGLGRVREAADAHLAITQRVGEADPERAHAHLAAALKLAPTHPRAMMLASSLEAFGRVPERAEALPAAPQADAPATTRRPARPQPSADKSLPPRRVTGAGVPPAPPEKTPPPRRVTGAGVPPEAPRRENSPLPGPLPRREVTPPPRREVTPPPRRLETTPPPAPPPRGDEADGERPTSTDDSGLLRFNAPKKMPPLPPGRGAGRGAKEGGVTPPAGRGEGRERGRSGTPAGRERGGDGDASEGEPEPSTAGDDAGRGEDEGGDAGVQVSESMLVHDAGADAATEATASTESEASEGPEPEEDAPRLRSGRLPSRELDRGLPTRRSSRRREARRRERSTPRGLPPVRAASGAHRASEASSEGQDPSDMSQETEEQSARARAEAADAVAELGPDGAGEAAPIAGPGEDAAGGEGDALEALTEVSDAPVEAAASDEAAVESAGVDPAPSDAGPEPEAPSADAAVASEGPGDADGSAEIDLEHRSDGSGAVEAEDAGPAAANIEPEAETSASSEVEDATEPTDDSRADSGIGAEVDPAAADAEVGATEDEAVVTDEDAAGRDDETEAESVEASGLDIEATATTEIAAEGEAIASPASAAPAAEAAAELPLSDGASTDAGESAPGADEADEAGEAAEAEATVSVEDAATVEAPTEDAPPSEATEEATIAEASPAEVTAEATPAEAPEEATPAEATPAEARVGSDIEAPAHEAPSTGESAPTPEAAREAGEDEGAGEEEEIEELDDVEVLDDEVELLDEGGDEAAPAAGAPPPLPTAAPPAPEPEPAEPVAAEAPEHDAGEPPAATEAEAPGHDAVAEPPTAPDTEAPGHDAAAEPPTATEAEAPEQDAAAEPPTEAATEVATEESAALDALDTPEGDDAPASASSSFVSLEDLAEAEEEATPAAAEPEIEWPDIADAVEELRFFLAQGFDDEAHVSFLDLQGRYPGHPALAEFAARFARLGDSTASAPVVLESEPELAAADSAPALSFAENDEEDDFLSSIFSDEPAPEKAKKADPPRARADLGDEGADARTLFDLGTAYREMGLIDDALQQFRGAARDPQWKARSLVMMASLHLHRGEIPEAITDLEEAVAAAVSDVERSEAHYELGVIYQVMGEHEKAIAALSEVKAGYRDRDERLAELKG